MENKYFMITEISKDKWLSMGIEESEYEQESIVMDTEIYLSVLFKDSGGSIIDDLVMLDREILKDIVDWGCRGDKV